MNATTTIAPEKITINTQALSTIEGFLPSHTTERGQTHEIEFNNFQDLIFSISGMIKTSIEALHLGLDSAEKRKKDDIIISVTNTLEVANKLLPFDALNFIDNLTNR